MKLEASDLRVNYGKRPILHGVDFCAEAGEVTMVVGPNGSGKTTLMRALSGDLAYCGEVSLNRREVCALKPYEMAQIRAVLAQETTLSFPFTVAEIIRIGLVSGGSPVPRDEIGGRIAQSLEIVDLSGFAGRLYQELSGGERQRVQLARVLCQIWEPMSDAGPRWLFLDEPVSSLDIRHQISIMALARDYASRGGGVIAVMHDLNLTAMYGDRVVVMNRGSVAASGRPEEVFRDDIISEAFGCRLQVGVAPPGGFFVLPQSATA